MSITKNLNTLWSNTNLINPDGSTTPFINPNNVVLTHNKVYKSILIDLNMARPGGSHK